jgi:protein TonB
MLSARHVASFLITTGVTFGLFWVMQALVTVAGELREGKRSQVVDFVRLRRDSEPEVKKREPPRRTPPPQPPPPPQLDFANNLNPDAAIGEIISVVDAELDLADATDLGSGGSDRDVVPLVRVEPTYPVRAAQRGTEGWVELRFTIAKSGAVKNAVVTASEPGTVFDNAALQAVARWRYNPKVSNGVAVEREGIRIRLRFSLDQ